MFLVILMLLLHDWNTRYVLYVGQHVGCIENRMIATMVGSLERVNREVMHLVCVCIISHLPLPQHDDKMKVGV